MIRKEKDRKKRAHRDFVHPLSSSPLHLGTSRVAVVLSMGNAWWWSDLEKEKA